MGRIRIFIDVPNIMRDGYGLSYLKILLERKKYEVLLGNTATNTFFTLFSFLPHIVILPQIEEIKGASLAKYAKALGSKVVVLPTEGAAYPKNNEEAGKYFIKKYSGDYDDITDLWLCWSEGYQNALIKYAGVEPTKVKICGCPRFDIYNEPLSRVLMKREEFCAKYNLDYTKKIVTLPTHFTFAELDVDHAKESIMHVEDYDYIVKRKNQEIEQRNITLENFVKLAKEFPDVFFILKLHPWEGGEFYINHIKDSGVNNIKIIKKEYIAHIINNSDVWLHVNCTTAKEAVFMNKPVITLAFLDKYINDLDDFSLLCDIAKTYEEMKEKVIYYLEGGKPAFGEGIEEYIRERYYKVDGKSTERCVTALECFINNTNIKPKRMIPFGLIQNMLRYDLRIVLKHFIYSRRYLRTPYLRLRWGKSE